MAMAEGADSRDCEAGATEQVEEGRTGSNPNERICNMSDYQRVARKGSWVVSSVGLIWMI